MSELSLKNRVLNATKASRKTEKKRKEKKRKEKNRIEKNRIEKKRKEKKRKEKKRKEKKRKEKERKEKKRWKHAEHKHGKGIPFRLTPYLSLSTSQQSFHLHIQLTINSLRFHSRSKVSLP